jgi:hypothetical protein
MRDRPKVFGPEIKDYQFRFFPNGTSTTAMTVALGTVLSDGGVTSVTRTSNAGEFTVVMDEPNLEILGIQGTVQHTTAADLKVQIGNITQTSTGLSFIVRVLAVATGTDITANANSSVMIQMRVKDSAA